MAKELLVNETLTETMIEAGAKLIKRLDAASAEVLAAFWLYSAEDKSWVLKIASPLVSIEGPKKYYRRILDANASAGDAEAVISLHNIGVTGASDRLVQLFRGAIRTGADIAEIRFSRNTINGMFIEDSLLYRVAA